MNDLARILGLAGLATEKSVAAPADRELKTEAAEGEITDEVWAAIVKRKQELMGPDEDEMEPEEAQDQAAEEMGVDPEELEDWLISKYELDEIKEGGFKNQMIDLQDALHNFAEEIQKGMHTYDDVVDELNDMFDDVKASDDKALINAYKTLRTLNPEDFGEGEGGGPNRASSVAQDAMDMIDGHDDSDYDHLPKIGEGRMSDQVIHDSETMTKEEFAKKHGKEMADEYYESIEEAAMCETCNESPCTCDDELTESPTMDTTQLVIMMRNAGLSEETIQTKLDEWANTPEGVGEVEPTAHGDAYDFAQSVNLSLKRYLDAQDMKVQVTEHKVENMKALYEAHKAKK